jgi:hypothetical protein
VRFYMIEVDAETLEGPPDREDHVKVTRADGEEFYGRVLEKFALHGVGYILVEIMVIH